MKTLKNIIFIILSITAIAVHAQNPDNVLVRTPPKTPAPDAKTAAKPQFVTRSLVKNEDGSLSDQVTVHKSLHSLSSITVAHNAKVAFCIDTAFYTEAQINNLPPEKIAQIKSAGVMELNPGWFTDTNFHGYVAVFKFEINGIPPGTFNKNYPWSKRLP